jgi:hypothetical protein
VEALTSNVLVKGEKGEGRGTKTTVVRTNEDE